MPIIQGGLSDESRRRAGRRLKRKKPRARARPIAVATPPRPTGTPTPSTPRFNFEGRPTRGGLVSKVITPRSRGGSRGRSLADFRAAVGTGPQEDSGSTAPRINTTIPRVDTISQNTLLGLIGDQQMIDFLTNLQQQPSGDLITELGDGGVGGGGAASTQPKPLHEIEWKDATFSNEFGRPPSWWVARVPKNVEDAERPDVQQLMELNSLIPFMSPEDQRRAAAQIYAANADKFSEYKPENIGGEVPVTAQTNRFSPGQDLSVIDKEYFQSRRRARGAIKQLDELRQQTVGGNRHKLGPGYTWLQQVLGALEAHGGGESRKLPGTAGDTSRQSRAQFLAAQGALDPLLAQAKSGELGGAGVIGSMFAQPFFSQGNLRDFTRGQDGRTFFGSPNQILFG